MIAKLKKTLLIMFCVAVLAAVLLPLLVAFLSLFVAAALVIAGGFVYFKAR